MERRTVFVLALATVAGLLCVSINNNDSNNASSTSAALFPHSPMGNIIGRRPDVPRSLNAMYDAVHGQCDRGNPDDLTERPLLIFKYSRTGSTWLAWTGNTLKLASGKKMIWTHEAQKCIKDSADGLSTWFTEYFGRETDGEIISIATKKAHTGMNRDCLVTVGKKDKRMGSLIATINPHESHYDTPEFSAEQWEQIFEAAPNLAIGVLVRTNAVKRAISAIASRVQLEICGLKKLTGREACIKDLPEKIYVNTTQLWSKIRESEEKRSIVTDAAARVSEKYGDGRLFCLSYESMQLDLTGEMRELGEFLGSAIDEDSLAKLSEESVSYKRGSDDLEGYLENYDEVKESLSTNPCLLAQLEEDEPKNFPLCGAYKGDEEEEEE